MLEALSDDDFVVAVGSMRINVEGPSCGGQAGTGSRRRGNAEPQRGTSLELEAARVGSELDLGMRVDEALGQSISRR